MRDWNSCFVEIEAVTQLPSGPINVKYSCDVSAQYKYLDLAMEALKKNTNNAQKHLSFPSNVGGVYEMAELTESIRN